MSLCCRAGGRRRGQPDRHAARSIAFEDSADLPAQPPALGGRPGPGGLELQVIEQLHPHRVGAVQPVKASDRREVGGFGCGRLVEGLDGLGPVSELVPGFLFWLVGGGWVDRLRRKPIILVADLGRALLIVTVPLAAFLGWLGL